MKILSLCPYEVKFSDTTGAPKICGHMSPWFSRIDQRHQPGWYFSKQAANLHIIAVSNTNGIFIIIDMQLSFEKDRFTGLYLSITILNTGYGSLDSFRNFLFLLYRLPPIFSIYCLKVLFTVDVESSYTIPVRHIVAVK